MSGTNYIASNWRVPENSNSSKNDNYSLSFDGTEYTTSLVSDLNSAYKFSFSFWAKKPTATDQINIGDRISTYEGAWISWYSDGNVYYSVRRGANESMSYALSFDTDWHHFAGTFDNGLAKLYIDGSLVDTFIFSTSFLPATTGDNFRIGAIDASTIGSGSISDVAIFDYALSDPQIESLAGRSETGAGNPMALKPTPVAYYPLGDNSASDPLTQPNVSVDDASVFEFDASTTSQFIDIFDGTSGSGPILFTASDDFSISAWIKTSSTATDNFILSFRGTALIWFNTFSTSGNIRFKTTLRDDSNNSIIIESYNNAAGWISADTWTNIIFTRNGTTKDLNLYLNGVQAQATTTDTTTDDFTAYDKLSIGNDNFSGGRYWFDGEMSNVAIFDSVVNESFIYNSSIPGDISSLNPAAWYKLNQSANWDVGGSGNWTIPDASGNGNDGTSSAMTSGNLVLSDLTRNLPYENYSMDFDSASSDYIDCGDVLDQSGTDAFSISSWIYLSSTKSNTIVSKMNSSFVGYQLYVNAANKLKFLLQGTGNLSATGTTVLSLNTWYNIILTYDGSGTTGGINLYLNGATETFTGSGSNSGGVSNSENFEIGARTGAVDEIDGLISNISIFNEELTSTDVLKLYANGMPQDLTNFTPQPMSWYPMGKQNFWNGSNWVIRDMIGTNDGTSANMGVDSLVGDAPRSEANGTGTNMDIPTNLVGNAGFSDKNAYSINMGPSARVTDTP